MAIDSDARLKYRHQKKSSANTDSNSVCLAYMSIKVRSLLLLILDTGTAQRRQTADGAAHQAIKEQNNLRGEVNCVHMHHM
jgi:hypothetical protein